MFLRKTAPAPRSRLVRRYMEAICIRVFYPGPNLSKRDQKARTYPYLLRYLNIKWPNQVWSIDITYRGLDDVTSSSIHSYRHGAVA